MSDKMPEPWGPFKQAFGADRVYAAPRNTPSVTPAVARTQANATGSHTNGNSAPLKTEAAVAEGANANPAAPKSRAATLCARFTELERRKNELCPDDGIASSLCRFAGGLVEAAGKPSATQLDYDKCGGALAAFAKRLDVRTAPASNPALPAAVPNPVAPPPSPPPQSQGAIFLARFDALETRKNTFSPRNADLDRQCEEVRGKVDTAFSLGAKQSDRDACDNALTAFEAALDAWVPPPPPTPQADPADAAPARAAIAEGPADQARQEAVDAIAALRKTFAAAGELDPHVSNIPKRLEERVANLDKSGVPVGELITGYQGVTNGAKTAAAFGKKKIEKTQAERRAIAASDRAKYEELTADEKKIRLAELAASEEGRQKMDDMVASLDGVAKSDGDKEFVKMVLEKRYDVVLQGKLGKKALPKLYKVLGMVPPSHTTRNDNLEKITRNSGLLDAIRKGAVGVYLHDSQEIVVNLPYSSLPFQRVKATGDRTAFDAFSFTTLHEVGHSVDDKLKFMTTNGSKLNYGGWAEESPLEIANKVLGPKNFHLALRDGAAYVPNRWLEKYLEIVLRTGQPPDPQEFLAKIVKPDQYAYAQWRIVKKGAESNREFKRIDAERAELTRNGANEDVWAAAFEKYEAKPPLINSNSENKPFSVELLALMLKGKKKLSDALTTMDSKYQCPAKVSVQELRNSVNHEAVKWCLQIRKLGLWDKGPSGAADAAVDGRVYQLSYENSWTSYALASRGDGVSDYQFRAAGEWFAELYAFYYSKKLPTSHPAYGWLHDQIDV
ncbi:MAG TPA: hypothetical protein VMF30_16950 [Pirellulales bacterium]|nr:hypothetical protein [Pirellulales bacterium]